ncbi:MAG TPA: HAMP domain-containing sensor histidine kinase [Bryobacteraceae bacterium]|jgi:signal transduction histidine kinase
MDIAIIKQRAWRAWASAGLLAVLCAVLAVLQSRWINEISVAERDRLREQLQTGLSQLAADLDSRVASACAGLMPDPAEFEQAGRDTVYANQYRRWREAHEPLFRRIALAVPEPGTVDLSMLDLDRAQFSATPWPPEWSGLRERLSARISGENVPQTPGRDSALIELPRFGPATDEFGGPGFEEQEWLIVELNLDYLRGSVLPELIYRYLGKDYDAEVVVNNDPSVVIYHSMPESEHLAEKSADAKAGLLETSYAGVTRRPRLLGKRNPAPPPIAPPQPPSGAARWKLLVRHRTGSVEQIVARLRFRNIALSGSILLLILATVTWLMRISRQAQRLAELQMNFVAGVSHELRTPLTVIRTAAFNLRGKIASRPDQVERYGKLIQDESEKLAVLVEQILRYGSSRSGRVIREREPVSMELMIEEGLRSSRVSVSSPELVIEKQLQPNLPLVLADEQALKHALRNLIDNAVKYGTEGNNWIGVFACTVEDEQGQAVEFRVADRGPGIPLDEQPHIFDPFFRGRRAVQDQIHGTGLGLNLVKKIVEAHGGTIRVKSEPMKGSEFIVRIPAAPPELQDEFANTTN